MYIYLQRARIMEARDVLKRPVITEKSSAAMAEDKYTFDVDTRANKTQVKIYLQP